MSLPAALVAPSPAPAAATAPPSWQVHRAASPLSQGHQGVGRAPLTPETSSHPRIHEPGLHSHSRPHAERTLLRGQLGMGISTHVVNVYKWTDSSTQRHLLQKAISQKYLPTYIVTYVSATQTPRRLCKRKVLPYRANTRLSVTQP